MSKPKQAKQFEDIAGHARRQVEYVPPEPQLVDQFAEDVCSRLAKKGSNACSDPEVVDGFAEFLNHIVRVAAKNLNRDSEYKKEISE